MKTEKAKKMKPLFSLEEVAMTIGAGTLMGNGVGELLNFMACEWRPGSSRGGRLFKSTIVLGIAGCKIATGIILARSILKKTDKKECNKKRED